MASLTGQLVAETYKALLKTIDNDILTASEKQITDGFGGGSNVFIDSQGFLRANKYKVTNGLATQFLKADGSLDANTYLTGITSSQIITALGYTPVTNARTLTINGTTYDLSANRSWTIAGTAAVWGNISGTLSNQTDLQNALNAKYNNPTGTISQYIRGDGSLATFPTLPGGLPIGGTTGQILAKIDATDYNAHWIDNYATQTKNEVKLGQTLAKGAAVYVSSANGTNMIVSAASNASEATSSKTLGLLETGGATNDLVKCVTFGLLAGLDTSTAQAGDPVWLGINGALIFGLVNKPYAPAHLVYIGVVTRVQQNNGEIFVNVQNGFELKEIHDVYIADPANNNGLFYDSADGLWKNKSIASVLGYTPQAQLNGTGFVKASGTTISYDNSTYLTTADAASTYQLLTNLSTDLTASATKYPSVNAVIAGLATKQNQLNGTGLVRMTGTTVSYDNNSYVTGSGSIGYISSWNTTTGLTNSSLFESSGSIGLNITNVNYSSYGRAFTGASFATSSFGYEIASGATADGGLLGGLAYVLISNDASRRIGAKIESNVIGTTATNLGANLRFYVKADNAAIAEIARMAASGVTFYSGITATSFVKTGGTSNEYLRADGSVNVITGDIISGSGTAGYIAKFGSSAVIASSNLYESAANIGFGTITLNYGSYGRAFTGAGFGSTSFGFEAATGSTTNGGLIGGLSLVIASNDSTRRIGSAIQSYISGTTSTHQGADLRFFVKPDNGVLLEVVRMTSAGITFNKDLTAANITATTFVKSGGLSTQFLMADGSVSTLSSPVTGSGSAGYIPKWTSASNLGSSNISDDGTSIGIAYTTPNKGGYGRTITGAAFGSASFGFEAVSNTTTNGGLIGGLSFIVNQNDSSRIVGSAIQSNLVGTTATNYGADLRFFAKADGVFTIAEVARMTSAGLRVYGTIIKDGGTASQFLMADGSVSTGIANTITGSLTNGYIPKATGANTLNDSMIYATGSFVGVNTSTQDTNAILNVNGNVRATQFRSMIDGADTIYAGGHYQQTISGTTYAFSQQLGAAGQIRWWTYNPTNSFVNHMTLTNSGNLLLNTGTDTGVKLNVNGSARFTGATTIGSDTAAGLFSVTPSATATRKVVLFSGADNNFQFYGFGVESSTLVYSTYTTGDDHVFFAGTGTATRNELARIKGTGGAFFNGNTTANGALISSAANYPQIVFKETTSATDSLIFYDNVATPKQMGFRVNSGTNVMSLTSTNVLIGTTTDSGFKLDVIGTSRFSGTLRLDGASYPFINIIGADTGNGGGIKFSGSSTQYAEMYGEYESPNNGQFFFRTRNAGSITTALRIQSTGAATFSNNIIAGDYIQSSTSLRVVRDGSNTIGGGPYLVLAQSANARQWIQQMDGSQRLTYYHYTGSQWIQPITFATNGNIGIGTVNPNELLHVYSSGTSGANIRMTDAGITDADWSLLPSTANTTAKFRIYNRSTAVDCINIFANGNMTIGPQTDAGQKLDVGGKTRIGTGGSTNAGVINITGGDVNQFNLTYNNTWGLLMGYGNGSISGGYHGLNVAAIINVQNAALILGTNNAPQMTIAGSGATTFVSSVTATSFFESSDFRLKTLIKHNPIMEGIEDLHAKLYEKNGKTELGYFAQDAEKYMPFAVSIGTDGFLSLSYREVHTAKIARLEKRVAELEKQLNLN